MAAGFSGIGLSGATLAISVGAVASVAVLGVVGWVVLSAPEDETAPMPASAEQGDTSSPEMPVAVETEVSPDDPEPESATAETASETAAVAPAPEPEPEPAAEPRPPQIDLVRVETSGATIVAGRAEPGAEVTLILDGAGIEATRVDETGAFVAMLTLPSSDAPRMLSLSMALDEGETIPSRESVIIAPTQRPAEALIARADGVAPDTEEGVAPGVAQETSAPAADNTADADPAPAEPEPQAPAVLIADDSGVRVVQPADDGPVVQDQIALDTITYNPEGAVVLAGRGQAETDLRVYLDNLPIHLAEINAVGEWQAELPQVDPGTYTLRVDQLGAEGQVISRVETPFLREEPAVLAAIPEPDETISVVTVQPGFTLWGIARDLLGEGTLYVQVYEANQELIRNPDLIYPGQVFAIPESVSE
ncbi:LysM peptidoglycan-binding domain-containing protein [Rhodophyticola sp. CCM32]|uniref:LysM peptidoglycan-binding domain-containing protein n=1 Tax=Rhodophyticola sp. CCM32 TaxID=2916397 RepID=UPI00143D449B|nr:LysM peptidoglycan-binding domain-containing protein [Rhodophyticola sp. CCM32]